MQIILKSHYVSVIFLSHICLYLYIVFQTSKLNDIHGKLNKIEFCYKFCRIWPLRRLAAIIIDILLHSRLRCNCSSLNQHLFSKNIVQSSLCACGHIEDTEHFLLHCPTYLNQTQDMLRSVSQLCHPSLNTLLYGNGNLSYNDNKNIFVIIQDFIVKSKRFQVNR